MNQLPSLAEKIAAPLKNTGKMIFVSGDGSGPSKLTTDIGNIMAGLPDTVETMTGMNIKNVLKRLEGKQGGVESTD
jgi:flotillin